MSSKTRVMHWSTFSMELPVLKGPKGYPECKSCVNGEFDPFACETCEDGSNYEPYDDDMSVEEAESIDYRDFIKIYREEFQ